MMLIVFVAECQALLKLSSEMRNEVETIMPKVHVVVVTKSH